MIPLVLVVIALMPIRISQLSETPVRITVALNKLYFLSPDRTQICVLEDDTAKSIYQSPSPLMSISSDGLFLYAIEKSGVAVISSDGKRIGTVKSGRFRDLSVNPRGFIYLLNWKGDQITVLHAAEEDFTLIHPADEIRASESGKIAVRSGNLIKIFDGRFAKIAEIKAPCSDFCFFQDELYVAGDSCLFKFDEGNVELKPVLKGAFRLLTPSAETLYMMDTTGTVFATVPTN